MTRPEDPDLRELKALMGRRTPAGPKRLGEVVSRLVARRGYVDDLGEEERRRVWRQAAGTLSAHSRPGRLQRGTLEIFVRNSVVLQEFGFQKSAIIARLKLEPGWDRIVDLRFRVAVID